MSSPEVSQTQGNAANKPTNTKGKKNIAVWVIGAVVAVVVFAGMAYMIMGLMGPSLTTYSSSNGYVVQVPKGYNQESDNFTSSFVERGGDGAITSGVLVFYQAFPVNMNSQAVKEGQEKLKTQGQNIIEILTEGRFTVENVTVTDTEADEGEKAYKVTADLTKDGTLAGKVQAKMVMTDRQTYVVAVVSKKAGSGLGNKADTILESFDVK